MMSTRKSPIRIHAQMRNPRKAESWAAPPPHPRFFMFMPTTKWAPGTWMRPPPHVNQDVGIYGPHYGSHFRDSNCISRLHVPPVVLPRGLSWATLCTKPHLTSLFPTNKETHCKLAQKGDVSNDQKGKRNRSLKNGHLRHG